MAQTCLNCGPEMFYVDSIQQEDKESTHHISPISQKPTMASLGNGWCNCKIHHCQSTFLPPISNHHKFSSFSESSSNGTSRRQKLPNFVAVRCISGGGGGEENNSTERRTFLTLEEAGLVEMSGLSTHESFLCRLTVQNSDICIITVNIYYFLYRYMI